MLDTEAKSVYVIAEIEWMLNRLAAKTGREFAVFGPSHAAIRPRPHRTQTRGDPMRHALATIAVVALIAPFGPARAQTQTEIFQHLDDLGRRNEKLQERVRALETENKALRERLRQLGAAEPNPSPSRPSLIPSPASQKSTSRA